MAIPIIHSLDIITELRDLGTPPAALFLAVFSPPGCGKTSWMKACEEKLGEKIFLMDGGVYEGSFGSGIPVIEQNANAQRAEDRYDVTIVIPRYKEMEEFLIGWDRDWEKHPRSPMMFVDEATQMSERARDMLVTEIVDGVCCKRLKEKGLITHDIKPFVVMLSNGRRYGGANNTSFTPRQVARAIQFVYAPTPGVSVPISKGMDENVADRVRQMMNHEGARTTMKEYARSTKKDFTDRGNGGGFSLRELPSNDPGNPRALETICWFSARIDEAYQTSGGIEGDKGKKLLNQVVNGYVKDEMVKDALALLTQLTKASRKIRDDLPQTIDEVRHRLKAPNVPTQDYDGVDWVAWAKTVLGSVEKTDRPQATRDLAKFAGKHTLNQEVQNVIAALP